MARWAPMAAWGGGALFVCARLLGHLDLPTGFPVEAVTLRPALVLSSLVSQDLLMIPLALAASSLPRLHAQYGRPLARSAAFGATLVWAGTLTLFAHAVGLLLGGSASFGANFAVLYGLGMLAFLLGMVVLGLPVLTRDVLSPEGKALPAAVAGLGLLALLSPVFQLGQVLFILFGVGWFFLGVDLHFVRREAAG